MGGHLKVLLPLRPLWVSETVRRSALAHEPGAPDGKTDELRHEEENERPGPQGGVLEQSSGQGGEGEEDGENLHARVEGNNIRNCFAELVDRDGRTHVEEREAEKVGEEQVLVNLGLVS